MSLCRVKVVQERESALTFVPAHAVWRGCDAVVKMTFRHREATGTGLVAERGEPSPLSSALSIFT